MKNRLSSWVWGLVFILIGIALGGAVLNFWDFRLFFDGWWTLFIIIPCLLSLFHARRLQFAPFAGLIVGVLLLFSQQGYFDGRLIWRMLLPILLLLLGLQIIFHNAFRPGPNPIQQEPIRAENKAGGFCNLAAVFSGREEHFTGSFTGASLTAVFGGIELNLREAKIETDVNISVTAVFGGVDIDLPQGVRAQVISTPIFGGVENKAGGLMSDTNSPVVYIDAMCVFGGVDIK